MTEPIAQHGIKIAGENPMIVLYRPGSDDIFVLASMWTARYSPVGSGHALLIWADPGESGLGAGAPIGIYTDNPALAEYVWEHFYRDYDTIRGRGIETGPPVRPSSSRSPAATDSTGSPVSPSPRRSSSNGGT